MTIYALKGRRSREIVTWHGKVLTHDSRAEMEYIFDPMTAKVVPLPRSIPEDQTMSIKFLPDLEGISWPLNKKEFRK